MCVGSKLDAVAHSVGQYAKVMFGTNPVTVSDSVRVLHITKWLADMTDQPRVVIFAKHGKFGLIVGV